MESSCIALDVSLWETGKSKNNKVWYQSPYKISSGIN